MQESFPVATIQFYYEVLGDSISAIAEKSRVPKQTIENLISQGEWKRPSGVAEETNLTPQEFYKSTREYLTLAKSHRAKTLLGRFTYLEDLSLAKMTEAFESVDTQDDKGITALTKLVTSLTKMMDSNPIYAEAITTPALIDRKAEGVNENEALDKLLDALDGKGRELPGETQPNGQETE